MYMQIVTTLTVELTHELVNQLKTNFHYKLCTDNTSPRDVAENIPMGATKPEISLPA